MSPREENDMVGLETLALFSHADKFNRWMFDCIAPHCKGRIFEMGSGIGNISKYLLEAGDRVVLSDVNKGYCKYLEDRFRHERSLEQVICADASAPTWLNPFPSLLHSFDTVVTLNVIEHIQNDGAAIANCKRLLRMNGQLVVLVPAFQGLYNRMDKELGHFRRYNKKTLSALCEEQGLKISETRYFNLAGVPGWWLSGRMGSKKIATRQLKLFNALVPLLKLADKPFKNLAGLSVIAVAVKEETDNP